jgi:hypothetical protein
MNQQAQPNKEKPPGLFSSSPVGLLAILAATTGTIALVSIGLELLTNQALAEFADWGIPFVSAPLGVGTLVLAGLTARYNPIWSAPAFVLGVAYWVVFMLGG